MKNFLLGTLFALIGIPLCQFCATRIEDISQLLSYQNAKKIYQIKKEIEQQYGGEEDEEGHQIGFQTQCIGYKVEDREQFDED